MQNPHLTYHYCRHTHQDGKNIWQIISIQKWGDKSNLSLFNNHNYFCFLLFNVIFTPEPFMSSKITIVLVFYFSDQLLISCDMQMRIFNLRYNYITVFYNYITEFKFVDYKFHTDRERPYIVI